MASVVSSIAEVKSTCFDIEEGCRGTFWSGKGQLDIDWNDDANMMVIGLDGDGNVLEWNGRAQDITGFAQSELAGYSFAHHLMSRPLAGIVDNALKNAWSGRDVGCFQIPFFTKPGRKLQLVINVSLSSPYPSKYLRLNAVTTDDVARRRASTDDNVMIAHVDLDGFVTDWDFGAQQISGFTRTDTIGKDFVNSFIPPSARELLEDALVQSLNGKEQYLNSPVPFLTAVGTKEWLLFRTLPRHKLIAGRIADQLAGVVFVANRMCELHTPKYDWADARASPALAAVEPDADTGIGIKDVNVKHSIGMLPTCDSLETVGDIGL